MLFSKMFSAFQNSNISLPILSQGDKFGMWDSVVHSSERLTSEMNLADTANSPAVSLVLNSCPRNRLNPEYLPDGYLLYLKETLLGNGKPLTKWKKTMNDF